MKSSEIDMSLRAHHVLFELLIHRIEDAEKRITELEELLTKPRKKSK